MRHVGSRGEVRTESNSTNLEGSDFYPVTSQGHLVTFKQGNGVTKFFSWWFLWGNGGSKYLFVEKGDKGGSWGCGLEQRC